MISLSKIAEAFEFFNTSVYEDRRYFNAEVLGKFYEYGIGTEQNFEKAIKCYKLAYERGRNNAALMSLGSIYYYGIGVEKDIGKAYEYYKIAAEKGNPAAFNKLGNMYLRGIHVEKDLNEALSYL